MNPFQQRSSAPVAANQPSAPIVRLDPLCREPATAIERLAVSVLRAEGAMPLNSLVERIASELYDEELRHGAWALDLGVFGSSLFVPEVASEIEARSGTLWHIENPTLQP